MYNERPILHSSLTYVFLVSNKEEHIQFYFNPNKR